MGTVEITIEVDLEQVSVAIDHSNEIYLNMKMEPFEENLPPNSNSNACPLSSSESNAAHLGG